MLQADPSKVSSRAKKRGLPQVNTVINSFLLHYIYILLENEHRPFLYSVWKYILFTCKDVDSASLHITTLQLGTLGAGNHYAEIQVVESIYDDLAASRMGVEEIGQVESYYKCTLLYIRIISVCIVYVCIMCSTVGRIVH